MAFSFNFFSSVSLATTSDNFKLNCSRLGEFAIPNQDKSFMLKGTEFAPSFTDQEIILESAEENWVINLENGDLTEGGETWSNCKILALPNVNSVEEATPKTNETAAGNANNFVEANCTDTKGDLMQFNFNTAGGEQNVGGLGKVEVLFTETKILVDTSSGQIVFQFADGKVFANGKDRGIICEYTNFSALKD